MINPFLAPEKMSAKDLVYVTGMTLVNFWTFVEDIKALEHPSNALTLPAMAMLYR